MIIDTSFKISLVPENTAVGIYDPDTMMLFLTLCVFADFQDVTSIPNTY